MLINNDAHGPWMDADRAYGEEHPELLWWVRPPLARELDAMRSGHMAGVAEQGKILERLVTDEPGAELCILVVRIPDGRVRLPVLRIGEGLYGPRPDGTLAEVKPEVVHAQISGMPSPVDMLMRDDCDRCERPLKTGDVTLEQGDLSFCLACALAQGGEFQGASVYFARAAGPGPGGEWPAPIRARVEAAGEFASRVARYGFDPKSARAFLRGRVSR